MLVSVLLIGCWVASGQSKKFYTLKNDCSFEMVDFHLDAPMGSYTIRTENQRHPLVIYGEPDFSKINPAFQTHSRDITKEISLTFEELQSTGITDLFGSIEESNNWDIVLSGSKKYDLDLNYAVGTANIDLSSVPVENLTINSGSANVIIDYKDPKGNLINMDTFKVQVDMGSVNAFNLSRSNAHVLIADIGLGSALLDLTAKSNMKCTIIATIAAGNLEILLTDNETPTIIHLKSSPLCGIQIPKNFEQPEDNVYINMAYNPKAENLRTFNIDVAMGNVVFKY